MNILIAEDEIISRNVLKTILEKKEHSVFAVENGNMALELISRDHKQIELVISDIDMPILNGLTLLKVIKSKWPEIPVIMLTGKDDKETIKEALKLGANDYLEKPIIHENVINSIKDVLHSSNHKNMMKMHSTVENIKQIHKTFVKNISEGPIQTRYLPFHAAGGDIYRLRPFNSDKTGLILADISGHNIASSYYAAEFSGILASVWENFEHPKDILKQLNNILLQREGYYVCLISLLWDKQKQIIHISNAGSPYGLKINAEGTTEWIILNGSMLGILDTPYFDSIKIELKKNDRLLFFTDGLADLLAEEDIVDRWIKYKDHSLTAAMDSMLQYIEQHHRNIRDDILLLGFESTE